MNFFWLIFAHCLADFPLQGQWLADTKGKEPLFMFAHVMIWTGCIVLAFMLLGFDITDQDILFLFGGHYLADWGKCKLLSDPENFCILCDDPVKNKVCKCCTRFLVYLDQLWHIVQLGVVYYL